MCGLWESRHTTLQAYFRLQQSRLQASTKHMYARDTRPFSNGTSPSQLRTNWTGIKWQTWLWLERTASATPSHNVHMQIQISSPNLDESQEWPQGPSKSQNSSKSQKVPIPDPHCHPYYFPVLYYWRTAWLRMFSSAATALFVLKLAIDTTTIIIITIIIISHSYAMKEEFDWGCSPVQQQHSLSSNSPSPPPPSPSTLPSSPLSSFPTTVLWKESVTEDVLQCSNSTLCNSPLPPPQPSTSPSSTPFPGIALWQEGLTYWGHPPVWQWHSSLVPGHSAGCRASDAGAATHTENKSHLCKHWYIYHKIILSQKKEIFLLQLILI